MRLYIVISKFDIFSLRIASRLIRIHANIQTYILEENIKNITKYRESIVN